MCVCVYFLVYFLPQSLYIHTNVCDIHTDLKNTYIHTYIQITKLINDKTQLHGLLSNAQAQTIALTDEKIEQQRKVSSAEVMFSVCVSVCVCVHTDTRMCVVCAYVCIAQSNNCSNT
jgi:hypothetical protein